jgi:hypothetical protein
LIHARIALETEIEPRRREPRIGVSAEVPLRQLGQTAVDARLVNLSSHGFMAETHALIAPGSRLWLTLPGVNRVNALVLWSKSGRIGGEFAQPIDPLLVFQALGKSQDEG